MEKRVAVFDSVEFRVHESDRGPVISAVSPPWDTLSVPLWRDHKTGKPVRERFMRGSFSRVLAQPGVDVKVYFEHGRQLLLGRTSSGTLRVREQPEGLGYDFDVPDTSTGRDLLALARRRDIRGSSFGFAVDESKLEWDETDEAIIRTVVDVDLLDHMAPTADPAYPASTLSARSIDEWQQELEAWRAGEPVAEWMAAYREGLARLAESDL